MRNNNISSVSFEQTSNVMASLVQKLDALSINDEKQRFYSTSVAKQLRPVADCL